MKKECKLRKGFCICFCMLVYPLRQTFGKLIGKIFRHRYSSPRMKQYRSQRFQRGIMNVLRFIGKALLFIGFGVAVIVGVGLVFAGLGYLYDLFFSFPHHWFHDGNSSLWNHIMLGELILFSVFIIGCVFFGLKKLIRNAWRDALKRCK